MLNHVPTRQEEEFILFMQAVGYLQRHPDKQVKRVNHVIEEAKKLAAKKITINEVSNEDFNVIYLLARQFSEIIEGLQFPNEYGKLSESLNNWYKNPHNVERFFA